MQSTEQERAKALCLRRLEKLPKELRLIVYEHMVRDDLVLIFPRDPWEPFRTTSVHSSEIHDLNLQIHDEYKAELYKNPFTIKATVNDFDFAHVSAFLNQMFDKALKTLSTSNKGSPRRFIIDLEVSYELP